MRKGMFQVTLNHSFKQAHYSLCLLTLLSGPTLEYD